MSYELHQSWPGQRTRVGEKPCVGRERSSPAFRLPRRAAATSGTCSAGSASAPHMTCTPNKGVRRTHVELYLRELEIQLPRPSNATLYRRISTLSSWFSWLEDEDVVVSNPAARVRRPSRHPRPQPWLDRNELTDLLAAAEDESGYPYALVCLLALNGLRVSQACGVDIADLGGWCYQPTLQVLDKGDKPALIVLNPRTYQAIDQAVTGRAHGPLLLNQAQRRMHNAAAIIRRLATTIGIARRVDPHAL